MLLSTVASSLPARTDSGGGDSMIADWFGRETAASLADADPAPAVHLQGVFTTFSIIIFAQFMNASLSVLANSLEQKRDLKFCILTGLFGSALCYGVFATAMAIFFGSSCDASVNVKWDNFTIRPVRWLLVGFPALDVFSVYPVNVIIGANDLMALYYTTPQALEQALIHFRVRSLWRCGLSLPSILLAFFFWDLNKTLAFTGVISMLLAFVVPAALYPIANARCREVFGSTSTLASKSLFLSSSTSSQSACVARTVLCFGVIAAILAFVNTITIDFEIDVAGWW
mmetsp:Transcript_4854/g.11431  ORF Transcript_4854/g.11431 Transcript_4854/m.11431 type:complete len:285 (+) Transcript_4854:3-857(+)